MIKSKAKIKIREFLKIIKYRSRKKEINRFIQIGLPKEIKPLLLFLVSGECNSEIKSVIKIAEDRRKEIAKGGDSKIPIWYSPKPSNAGEDVSAESRPNPGKVLEFTMEQVAKTGKNKKWGTVIHLLVKEFQVSKGIELGTCAGISGIYISTVPTLKSFVTVEGSEALAGIAKKSLKPFANAKVLNMLFDEALDLELVSSEKYDLAFIDGHHEKVATIHYFNRLIPMLVPGAVVVFDDISWSYDMRNAWEIIEKRKEFAHTIDLGAVGICIMKETRELSTDPKNWNLQALIGRRKIGDPHGWKL